jgi:hypothetical protein
MKPQFTTTVITDLEGLFERHDLLFKQNLKGKVINSYQVKKGSIFLYVFTKFFC